MTRSPAAAGLRRSPSIWERTTIWERTMKAGGPGLAPKSREADVRAGLA